MSRRKGTPCACECDPCGSKKCIKAINNVSGDPNGDFEIKAGNGIGISQSGDNSITIINQAMASSFVAGDNIEINPSGDDLEIRLTDNPVINGTLQVNGDIIQQGASYETHAEKVYTTNDYIYMRDGALAGLAAGDYAGFQVKLYDGVNDGRLVIDNSGVARVGDVGDEQPLLTREESANLNNGALLKWDAANLKAVDEGTVGSDTNPIKIVNGVATPVTNELMKGTRSSGYLTPTSAVGTGQGIWSKSGHIVVITYAFQPLAAGIHKFFDVPFPMQTQIYCPSLENSLRAPRDTYADDSGIKIDVVAGDTSIVGTFTYITPS